ncbi:MAG: hypothetical protein AAF663_00670 [Planctomycetota bacterium]
MHRPPFTTLALVATLGAPALALAETRTILIDFGRGNATDGSVIRQSDPNGAERWNDIFTPTATTFQTFDQFPAANDLIDTAGVSTGFTFDLIGNNGNVPPPTSSLGIGGFNTPPSPNTTPFPDSAASDTLFLNADAVGAEPVATFALSDLDPAKTYDLDFYGFIGSQTRRDNVWTVNGQSVSNNPNEATASVVSLGGLTPDGSGVLNIDWSLGPATPGAFSQGQWNTLRVVESGGSTVLIDFGRDDTLSDPNGAERWNDYAGPANTAPIPDPADLPANLIDMISSTGGATGFDFSYVTTTGAPLPNGVGAGIASGDFLDPTSVPFPETATRDSLFVNSEGRDTEVIFELGGLNAGSTYDLEMFGAIGGFRNLTEFIINGESKTLETSFNTSETVEFTGISANAEGNILISLGTIENEDPATFDQAQWSLLKIVETLGEVTGIVGDYDDDGQVAQGDLNLVLNNWGAPRPFDPNGDPFETANVDQEELNRVLNNWGAQAAPSFAGFSVPEPSSAAAVVIFGSALLRRRSE